MEIKIPKEVRLHKETVLFGLTLRQLLCSGLAVGTAVMVYLAAAPFAVAGFFQYNGLTFGQFLWAVLKSQVLYAGPRVFRAENLYCAALSRKGKPYDTEDC